MKVTTVQELEDAIGIVVPEGGPDAFIEQLKMDTSDEVVANLLSRAEQLAAMAILRMIQGDEVNGPGILLNLEAGYLTGLTVGYRLAKYLEM